MMEQVNYRRGEDLRFVGHDRTLRIHHLRVNCDSNLIVAYISYMHMASPSSEILVSFRLGCGRDLVADLGRQSRTRVGSGPLVHLGTHARPTEAAGIATVFRAHP